jgi:hypothetical protein
VGSDITQNTKKIGVVMNDKNFVMEIIPTATCVPFDVGIFMFIVYAVDGHGRQYELGHSKTSEEDAWYQVAETFRQKMLLQLEAA